MAQITQINDQLLLPADATQPNPALNRQQGAPTQRNPLLQEGEGLLPGQMLLEHYRVEKRLELRTGEADLYLCSRNDRKFVAKVYRRTVSVKKTVLKKLMEMDCPWVAPVYASGNHQGMTVEVLPYFSRGSLQGKQLGFDQLRKKVIPCLNEGLRALHEAQIIHKDLKPSNIMLADDQGGVAIIDFGISSVLLDGNTLLVTSTGMTPVYSAPETFKGLFLPISDYYSLGITLYELFSGSTPYSSDMTSQDIERYISVQRIPFPKEMPVDLQELIKGLTYYDISNRREKENPNRRWGYEEVKKWLAGERQTIPGEGVDRRNVQPYQFLGKPYDTRLELVRALIRNWQEGKKQLFRGYLSDYYRIYDSQAFRICQAAENEAARVVGRDDLIFWKTMYALDPEAKEFFWIGRLYAGLPAMGRDLLEHLWKNDPAMQTFMGSLYRNGILSAYVRMKDPENLEMLEAMQALEDSFRACRENSREYWIVLYLTAYMLSGQKILRICGREFRDIAELTAHMRSILGENCQNLEQLRSFSHMLIDQYDHLTPAFESWLIALGKRDALESWRAAMQNPQQ